MIDLIMLVLLIFMTYVNYKLNKHISIVVSLFVLAIVVFTLSGTSTTLELLIAAFFTVVNLMITVSKVVR